MQILSLIKDVPSSNKYNLIIDTIKFSLSLILILFLISPVSAQYLGNLSNNPFAPNSTANPYTGGNAYDSNSIKNPYGAYGSPYSNKSATNPYTMDAPKIYDQNGNYHGKLSANTYDPESISNPYGRFGSRYSADSINNPYGSGSPYSPSSPNDPSGQGMSIYGDGEN